MSKKIISIFLAVAILVTMAAVAVVSVSAEETKTYYFVMPEDWYNEEFGGDGAGIYWWEGPGAQDAWPGVNAQRTNIDNLYKKEVSSDVATIVWNNRIDGGEDKGAAIHEAARQTINVSAEYYDELDANDTYPEGLGEDGRGFNKMVYVTDPSKTEENEHSGKISYVGEWFFFYGVNEDGTIDYGTDPSKEVDIDVLDTTEPLEEAIVNGEKVHVGDTVTFTQKLTVGEKLENIQAILHYSDSVLKLTDVNFSEDGTEEMPELDTLKVFPVLAPGGVVANPNLEDMIKFNASNISLKYDFTAGATLITVEFEVISVGETDINVEIEEMNSTDTTYVAKGEMLEDYDTEGTISVVCPHTTIPVETDPTKAPTETTTGGGTDTTVAPSTSSDDVKPTDATSSVDGGDGTIKTGSVSVAATLLVLLIAATGVMVVVRKKNEA